MVKSSRRNNITTTIKQVLVEGSWKGGRLKRKYIDDNKEWTKFDIDDILLEVDGHVKWRRRCLCKYCYDFP